MSGGDGLNEEMVDNLRCKVQENNDAGYTKTWSAGRRDSAVFLGVCKSGGRNGGRNGPRQMTRVNHSLPLFRSNETGSMIRQ